ncbi:MAG: mersacidin/lichenicidin family type 2 lantibiotic [Steroidobacteraceae bacterium]|jgi:mersacidin/lichenicidin family type 2 lantibiotic
MTIDIVRAWKDSQYRKTLTATELAMIPQNPAGIAELSAEELNEVSGAAIDTFGPIHKSPN